MNPVLVRAVIVVTLALIFYSTGIITEQKKKTVSKSVLLFLTLGILFDISSTILMILGTKNIATGYHGYLGYSALAVMLVDTILIWIHWLRKGGVPLPEKLNLYTRIAYSWWVIAYIVGAAMSMLL
jgi:hypothetical protein